MYKFLLLFSLVLLPSCYRYKETNSLAIPPIARDELKSTTTNKK